ncbi:MAG: transporter [Verrucomicrobia bacterium]|nr:transporter [Verrucomicrobiota bacterium]
MRPAGSRAHAITPSVDRWNGLIFIWAQLLIYFAAPVIYVGIVQAGYCDRLGASATVANLPQAAYLFGSVTPFLSAWLFSPRYDRQIAASAFHVLGASILVVGVSVFVPLPDGVHVGILIGQGLVAGLATNLTNIYGLKCLARGTTEAGRGWAYKYAFGFGPLAAVLGSLAAQAVLAEKLPHIHYPNTVALVYLVAAPCMLACGWLLSKSELGPEPPHVRQGLGGYVRDSCRALGGDRRLLLVWCGFLAWYVTLNAMTNLSLYSREAMGRSPLELAGAFMALRFSFKAVAGFGLGTIAARRGAWLPVMITVVLVGAGIGWAYFSTGKAYLVAFGLMGAGELGGIYFFNYFISISAPEHVARNLGMLALVTPLSAVAPPLYGLVTDRFGFHASFAMGIIAAVIALVLVAAARRPGNFAAAAAAP